MPFSVVKLMGRRLAFTAGALACLGLGAGLAGSGARARLEGLPLTWAMQAMARPAGERVVWIDTQRETDLAAITSGLEVVRRGRIAGVVLALKSDHILAADARRDAAVNALPVVVAVGKGEREPPDSETAAGADIVAPLVRISGLAGIDNGLAAAATRIAVEGIDSPDGDGVRRLFPLAARAGDGVVASATLAAALLGQPRNAPLFVDATHAGGSTPPRYIGDGLITPLYGPPVGARGGLRRVLLADLTLPEFDAGSLEGDLVVFGHGDLLTSPLGPRPAAELLAERIEAFTAGAYACPPRHAGWLRIGACLVAALLAALVAPVLTRRFGVITAVLIAAVGVAALLLVELVLLQSGVYFPLLWPALVWLVALIGSAASERRRDFAAALATGASVIGHAGHTPVPRPLRRASDRMPPPATAQAPIAATTGGFEDSDFFERTGSFTRTGGMLASTSPTATLRPVGQPLHPSLRPRPRLRAATNLAEPRSLADLDAAMQGTELESNADITARLLSGGPATDSRPRVGRYRIERELGRGAASTVYLVRDEHDKVFALKAIEIGADGHPDGDTAADVRARFFREAETAGRLDHPGIVRVHGFGEQGNLAYLAMDYAQGEMLSAYTSSARLLPARDVLTIVASIADALDHAHAVGIVHRDIKPANVMFDRSTLAARVTDFGIAKLSDVSQTRTGIVLGTPSFMAPEQLEGGTVTGRSDLFALGVTLFQLLTGQLPFMADSMPGLMERIATAPHPPLASIRPDLPACVGDILDKALDKDPERRFGTAGDMAQALRDCAARLES
jgi:eukaryotic-like serine/threonine-protein kinase